MDNLSKLTEFFAHFPGIGPRQAKRFVYYLLNKSPAYIAEFTRLIEEAKKSTSECNQCHRFFTSVQATHTCSICLDPNRDHQTLMIVARDSDFETIEKSSAYKGLYFILGGTVPVLDKEPEKRIRLETLLRYIVDSKNLREVILSLNTTPDGEHTAHIVKEALQKISSSSPLKITILGRGLSTGAELEYADSETIKSALKNRN
ncbi:MAG: toprim domain-containing protein [Candidatus Taylorbacteria bacterium]